MKLNIMRKKNFDVVVSKPHTSIFLLLRKAKKKLFKKLFLANK
jgi:hypothetical protein